MKINGVNQTKAINLYNDYKKNVEKKDVKAKGDSIEISSLGKSMSAFSPDNTYVNSKEKIESITKEVASGNYNRDSKLIAKKMLNNINNTK